MDRAEIELKLHADRIWLIETFVAMSEADLTRPATPSENDPDNYWSAQDHLVHLAGIEGNFNRIIRRHMAGEGNAVRLSNAQGGQPRSREEVMAGVHQMNEDWVQRHAGKSLSEILALGESVRGDTLKLLSDLTDAQLAEVVPGAPWADGVIGGILLVNGDHARTHLRWVREGWASG